MQEIRTEDMGDGNAVTYYDNGDGSGTYVIWNITTGEGVSEGRFDMTDDEPGGSSYSNGAGSGEDGNRGGGGIKGNNGPSEGDQWDGPDEARYLKGTNPADWTGPSYARVYKPTGKAYDTSNGRASPANPTGNSYASPEAISAAIKVATEQAQQEYLRAKLDLERDQFNNLSAYQKEELAFKKAESAFTQKYQEAQLTGEYNGQPTWAKVAQEAGLTGYYNGANTLARDQLNQQTALGVMQVGAQLRGPRNAFQFAKVMGGTPGGLPDIVSAAMGQYKLPGSGGANYRAPQEAASVGGLIADIQHPPQAPSYGGSYRGPAAVTPPGVPAPANQYNYEPTGAGGYNVYPPGVHAPDNRGQYSTTLPMNPHEANSAAHGQAESTLPLPSQWNANNVNNMNTYQKDLMLAAYENAGWDPTAAWEEFQSSLPNYGGPKRGTVAVPIA